MEREKPLLRIQQAAEVSVREGVFSTLLARKIRERRTEGDYGEKIASSDGMGARVNQKDSAL